jgi:predicted ribosomally synthesized peptide with SipW-like signal peptide
MGEFKMKKRIILLGSIIALLTLVIAGGTMAWFSSTPDPVSNTFTAGTVSIGINENGFTNVENWNPGQTSPKNVDITITSSKQTYVRVKLTPSWESPLPLDFVDINFTDLDKWVFADGTHPTAVMHANDPRLAGYLYYTDIVTGPTTSINLIDSVKFLGKSYLDPLTDQNSYQGKKFTLNIAAEGVQASHDAYKDVWGLTTLPTGITPWVAQ